jgi:putative peptidoglycan lipid II flippase
MAVFPTMNAQVAREEIADFKRTFSLGLRGIFLITLPASAGLMALREPIIQLPFQQGMFSASDARVTAWVLMFYCLGLFAYSALQLMNRVFYSLKDTWTPVIIGILSIVLNRIFAYFLIPYLQAAGLALAYSLAGVVNIVLLLVILRWRVGAFGGGRIVKSLVISTGASLVMYAVVRFADLHMVNLLKFAPKVNDLITLVVGMTLGVVVYGVLILIFRLEESQLILNMIKKRIPALHFLG